MEKDNKQKTSVISKLASSVQSNIQKLYKNTYFSGSDNYSDLKNIKTNIDTSIDNIISNNVGAVGVPNISKLYSRIQMKNKEGESGGKLIGEIENMFTDPTVTDGILSTYAQNKYLRDMDEEIDLICKYMPQLEDALDAKKDNVLAADHFSKDFINVENKTNIDQEITFFERIDELKSTYNLLELFEDIYDKTAHYGEQFIYIVPYKKALSRLFTSKNGGYSGVIVTNEAVDMAISGKIVETIDPSKILAESGTLSNSNTSNAGNNMGELDVELNISGVVESAVNEYATVQKIYENKSSKTTDGNLEFEGSEASDGFINSKLNSNTNTDQVKIDIPGCIIKKLRREQVVPLYIDGLCLGYYYFECDGADAFTKSGSMSDPMMALKSGKFSMSQDEYKKEEMIKTVSSRLSHFIDAKFTNTNQDLGKEIYMILKHNDMFNINNQNQLKVTFIPPNDMVHMYFRQDDTTNRGISDLDKSLLPGKLYTSLYVTNTIGILTRGQDKRVYYVNQNIDSNISQTLLNTINQIKKSNFGARELSSVKNILNITGRYNDYVIPKGPSGEAPIQFEIMPGQDIDPKMDLMNTLEQMAINGTDVPYEFIQARQTVDYAVRLTMSNGKFLRKVFKRQAQVQQFYSRILTAIYNSEYMANEEISVTLPPPAFLNITNTNQMMQNTSDYVESIIDMEAGGETDDVKTAFRQRLKRHYLNTYLDLNIINEIKEKAILDVKSKIPTEAQ